MLSASVQFRLFATPWTTARQASPFITNSPSMLRLISIKSVMPSNHQILCHPLLLLLSVFPSIRDFSNESVLCIRWPKCWSFSFSISPCSEYSGLISFFFFFLIFLKFALRLTGLIALWSKGLSRVFSNTTDQRHQFFGTQLYGPTLISIYDYWKNHSFDYTDLCRQSGVCFLVCCLGCS